MAEPRERPSHLTIRLVGGAAALVAAGFAFDAWFMPSRVPSFRNPSIWQVLIASRWAIGALRLAGLVAVVYLMLSILVRIRHGQWLIKVASAEVGDSVQAVADDRERLQEELDTAHQTILTLSKEYARALSLDTPDADSGAADGVGG